MNTKINYYGILGLPKDSQTKEIRKRYLDLSKIHHPDKGGDAVVFDQICEAYTVLTNISREDYDLKSIYGLNYDESIELQDFDFDNLNKGWDQEKYDQAKADSLNIVVYIDENFDGGVTYERYIMCSDCRGTGKDKSTRIKIETSTGFVYMDGDDTCDFCDGSGKDHKGKMCNYCKGMGKLGTNDCETCTGQKRILGKQKVKDIVIPDGETDKKVEFMGHFSKDGKRKGHLWVVKKQK